ncbi:MAG TPA: histidine kinase dimerization/phosphoacceptor domain -containing protein [Devosia sp.]|nr:histidine kinase dimerization/phosphoacceptor domain -containing protein [Devosia sp.]
MSAEAGSAPISADTRPPRSSSTEPRPKRRWEAADTVIAISVGLVVIIMGIFALLCVQGYSATIENTKTRVQTAANIVAEETRWVVASAITLAQGAGGAFNWDPAQASAASLQRFNSVTALMPTTLAVGVYDATGAGVADASSPGVPSHIGDRDYFHALAAGADWAISAQEADTADGKAIFAVVRRLGPPEKFLGAVMIAIDASVLENLAAPQNLGPGSTISIVRPDGWVIARLPSLTAPLNLAGTPAFVSLTSSPVGTYISPSSPADGVSRMVAYRHVDDLGYIAIASVSLDAALGGLWTSIWIVTWLIAPIALALLIGSFITARLLRRTQATSRSLAAALEHNEVLFREIHHRVKNNLQSVSSLLQLQPIPREIKIDMGQRIAAMSAVHEHIYRSNQFATVQVKDYLHKLIENLGAGFDPNIKVVEQIEDLSVDRDAATPLGLIVNEVVSNAFKHAFKNRQAGIITVSLTTENGRGKLVVRDNGVGFDPEQPAKGIGRRLISALTSQLGGESIQSNDGGAVFTLTFPLAQPGTD